MGTGLLVHFLYTHTLDLAVVLNCVLAGLVSITAGCATVEPWHALFIGMVGAVVYIFTSSAVLALKVDDPLDAVAVHGGGGMWGCLAVGIFSTRELVQAAYNCPGEGGQGNSNGLQFGVQLLGVVCIVAWVSANTLLIFLALKYTVGIRVSDHAELVGLDESEHGACAYELNIAGAGFDMVKAERLVRAAQSAAEHAKAAASGPSPGEVSDPPKPPKEEEGNSDSVAQA